MSKDTAKDKFYLKHDTTASEDQKIQEMMIVYDFAGYGRYWKLNELMRQDNYYCLNLGGKYCWQMFGKTLNLTADEAKKFIMDLIEEFKLYETDGKTFWSDRLRHDAQSYESKVKQTREAAAASVQRRREKAGLQEINFPENPPVFSDSLASVQRSSKRKHDSVERLNLTKLNLIKDNLTKVNEIQLNEPLLALEKQFPEFYQNEKFLDAFTQFLRVRKQKEKPVTGKAVRLIMADLCMWTSQEPEEAAKIVDVSNRKGWTDIYKPDQIQGKKNDKSTLTSNYESAKNNLKKNANTYKPKG